MVTEHEKKKDKKTENEPNLKGTMVSVSIVGALLLLSWFIVFFIFIAR